MTNMQHRISAAVMPAIGLASVAVQLREWIARARSRRDIAKLDERTIRDLGLCPSQMLFEASKPFWRP